MSEHEDFELIDGQYDHLMQESFLNKQERDDLINPKHLAQIKVGKVKSHHPELKNEKMEGSDSSEEDFEILEQTPQLQKALSQMLEKNQKRRGSNRAKKDFNQKLGDFIKDERKLLQEQTFANEQLQVPEDEKHEKRFEHIPIDQWFKERDHLVLEANREEFANDINLNERELKAQKKLFKLRSDMLEKDPVIHTGPYEEKRPLLMASDIYAILDVMPKPVIHHIHLTAASTAEYLVDKLCYYDYVYYNMKANRFIVSPKEPCTTPGYVAVNRLRQYWASSTAFDEDLVRRIKLGADAVGTQESHAVWKAFQPKFDLTFELYNYHKFFEEMLYRVCKDCVKQVVTVIEFKHIFGCVFDDDHKPIGVKRELEIFKRVQDLVQARFKLFQMKIVVCGLKGLPTLEASKGHVQSQIEAYFEGKKIAPEMVIAFDLVQEEDFSWPIDEFLPQIYEAKAKAINDGDTFHCMMHAGETNSRDSKQIYDAILLGSKRIGHGFNIAWRPNLLHVLKLNDICIECCPVSNFVLGYCLDMRNHPVRSFLHAGIPVSISPDDPGFMSYNGVTLDYVYAFLAWELDIADLKKLCTNSIKYSSLSKEDREQLHKFFLYKWKRFLDYVIGKF